MSDQTDTLVKQLSRFGLSADEASVYLEITKNGSSTALSLSRSLHTARTRVYRILDKLIADGLIVRKKGERGTVFETGGAGTFDLLIAKKKADLESLQKHPLLITHFGKFKSEALAHYSWSSVHDTDYISSSMAAQAR